MSQKTFIVGRCGDIHLDDPSVSRRHLEIVITNGEIFIRDLDSSNGTYLIKNNRAIPFRHGYVQQNQWLIIGQKRCQVCDLLRQAGVMNKWA